MAHLQDRGHSVAGGQHERSWERMQGQVLRLESERAISKMALVRASVHAIEGAPSEWLLAGTGSRE